MQPGTEKCQGSCHTLRTQLPPTSFPGPPGDLDYLGVRWFLYEVVTLTSQVSPGGSGPVAGWRHARGMTDTFLATPGYGGDQGQAGT